MVTVALAWPWVASRVLAVVDGARPVGMTLVFAITGGLGLAAFLVRRRWGLDSFPPTPVRHWLVVVAAVVFGEFAAAVLLVLAPSGSASDDRSIAVMIVAAVGSSTVVPFAEEVIYRGLLFQLLRFRSVGATGRWPEGGARLRALVPAVATSSALFGIAHYEVASASGMVYLAGVGAVLALVYEFTGRLWAPKLIHSSLNLAASLGEFNLSPGVVAGVSTAAMVGVAICACRRRPRLVTAPIEESGNGVRR